LVCILLLGGWRKYAIWLVMIWTDKRTRVSKASWTVKLHIKYYIYSSSRRDAYHSMREVTNNILYNHHHQYCCIHDYNSILYRIEHTFNLKSIENVKEPRKIEKEKQFRLVTPGKPLPVTNKTSKFGDYE
jgi:hypothetical protein